jgi:kinesin family member 5
MSDSMMVSTVAPPQPLLSSRTGPITDEERKKYEEERSKLYQQLDEKDDEIQEQSRKAAMLKQQLDEQVKLNHTCYIDIEI